MDQEMTKAKMCGMIFQLSGYQERCENEIKWELDKDGKPPAPIFNRYDNRTCQAKINELHEWSTNTYDSSTRNEAKLNKSY